MIIVIVYIMILHYRGAGLMLSVSDGRISKTSNIDTNRDFDKLDTSLFEAYPVIVPQDRILQICLKDSSLLDKLHSNKNDCDDYPCMFSKLIQDESMNSVVSIVRNETTDRIDRDFEQSIQDCIVWWKLFKHFDKNSNPRRELGKCLFQTFSSKCREDVLNTIKLLLLSVKEN